MIWVSGVSLGRMKIPVEETDYKQNKPVKRFLIIEYFYKNTPLE